MHQNPTMPLWRFAVKEPFRTLLDAKTLVFMWFFAHYDALLDSIGRR